ncbi:small acid-soluble spore protein H (minor) [Bacillus mesophilus]|uniref:Small, acid-soluble spore protein H n=1 Tax=Bacillus mesophilus TaxID=1808955 RepID=A0A6M0QAI2_9BACI|nr:H-type small acid-soluble spore protein [Bacillus mesophilus]MBM7661375.1 small acid-soluble spore protein H (minor) [Bacillus mesophilus]NEY72048.1 H-type small acid-soluble spore protein [Bacillus mesophilus]
MEMNRVKQIVSSPAEITVKYHGVPVWIQSVDEHANTARVYTRSAPEEEMDIPVGELIEE